mgnify:CR=1 FL=1
MISLEGFETFLWDLTFYKRNVTRDEFPMYLYFRGTTSMWYVGESYDKDDAVISSVELGRNCPNNVDRWQVSVEGTWTEHENITADCLGNFLMMSTTCQTFYLKIKTFLKSK